MPIILIALGANLGDRGETLNEAIDQLAADPSFTLLKRSQLLVTRPIGGPDGQPDFLNAAAKFETSLSPGEVHQKLIEVEETHGRVRKQRWGARSLDLDLLLYDSQTIDTPRLTVPHPRMSFRRFVLQPAAEVAAEMIHPELGATIGQLWQQLNSAPPRIELATLPGPTAWHLCHSVQQKLSEGTLFVPSPPGTWPEAIDRLPQTWQMALEQESLVPSPPAGFDFSLLPWWSELPPAMWDTFFLPTDSSALAALASEPPRLVVFWIPPDEFLDPIERGWRSAEQRQTLSEDLAAAVRREVHAPRLWLGACDATAAVTEIAAAIEAIRG